MAGLDGHDLAKALGLFLPHLLCSVSGESAGRGSCPAALFTIGLAASLRRQMAFFLPDQGVKRARPFGSLGASSEAVTNESEGTGENQR